MCARLSANCAYASSPLTTDIFVPELRMRGDEVLHHLDAFREVEIDYFHAVTAHKLESTTKGPALAHDHFADLKLHDRAAAQIAGHERRIENGVAKTPDSPGIPQTIDLRVRHWIVFLHALVVTSREQFPIARQ